MISTTLFILIFVAILTFLILIHELGHFIAAKFAGVKVLEFGLGFPPRLLAVRNGETVYSVNAIPLGGFVKMVGEEDPTELRSLASKTLRVRLMVIVAGPLMNFIVALVLFTVSFMIPQDTLVGKILVTEIHSNSPAHQAGILVGDTIMSANGNVLDNHLDLGLAINRNLGSQMTWTIQRDRQQSNVEIIPRLNPPSNQGATGITVSTTEGHLETRSQLPWTAFASGLATMSDIIVVARNEFANWLAGGPAPKVAGPIGMGQIFSEVAQQNDFQFKDRILFIINLAAVISLSLAIFNILPIPALDGGRLPFLFLEWIRGGKRVPPRLESFVHVTGFTILISLAFLVAAIDINRISSGQSFLGG